MKERDTLWQRVVENNFGVIEIEIYFNFFLMKIIYCMRCLDLG